MNTARRVAVEAEARAGRAASWAGIPGAALVGVGLAGMLGAAVVTAIGRFGIAGAILGLAAVAAFGGRAAGGAEGWPSRWTGYLCTVQDRVGDAPVLAGIAWWMRPDARAAIVAVAAVSLVFLGAYAEVRGRALGYAAPGPIAGAPERSAVIAAGLLIPQLAEGSLWAVCALGAASFIRVGAAVIKESAVR